MTKRLDDDRVVCPHCGHDGEHGRVETYWLCGRCHRRFLFLTEHDRRMLRSLNISPS